MRQCLNLTMFFVCVFFSVFCLEPLVWCGDWRMAFFVLVVVPCTETHIHCELRLINDGFMCVHANKMCIQLGSI